jgi:PAS domain S-box-containing protein
VEAGQITTADPGSPADGWRKLFGTVFKSSGNPMALLTPRRVVVVLNPAFTATLGYTNEETVGRRADMFVEGSRDQVEPDWAELGRTGRLTMNRFWRAADGRVTEVQFAAHRTTVEGRALVLLVVLECDLCPVARRGKSPPARGPLTPRELEVVAHIAAGEQLPQIAEALFISPSTVRTHVRNAMEKLDARTQAQLVAVTIAERLIDPEPIIRQARRRVS